MKKTGRRPNLQPTSAQPFTSHNPDKDFNTLGLVGDNKNPIGLCAVKHPTSGKMYMLVSASRDGKIYTYDMEGKERQDNHHGYQPSTTSSASQTGLTDSSAGV